MTLRSAHGDVGPVTATAAGNRPEVLLGTVVIPAHDEAATIGAALEALLGRAAPGELHVVVACNGCSDQTAAVARSTVSRFPDLVSQVVVLELEVASKVAAIRAAEALSPDGPRLYLDADVLCPTGTARQLLASVGDGGAPVAVPSRDFDTARLGRAARLYHRTWSELPWVREQAAGRGAYALSAALRSTFGQFPDVVADDRWATTRCPRDQVAVVPGPVTISPPRRVRDLVAVRSRVYAGNVSAQAPTHDADRAARVRGLLALARDPRRVPGLVVFATVTATAKARAGRSSRAGGPVPWGRAVQRGPVVERGAEPGGEPRATARRRSLPDPDLDLSVVVLTYRSAGYVQECLAALVHELDGLSAELVVVDNASGDGIEDVVRRVAPEAVLVSREVNDGFARGCHVGVARSRGRRLLFCNPDAVVGPGAVRALLAAADEHPGAGVVGGRSVGRDGATDPRSWWGRPTLWSSLCFAVGASSAFPGHPVLDPESPDRWDGRARTVPVVSGGMMLVDRALWQAVDGFDEEFLLYGEDADLCLRAARAGYQPRVCPDATYVHSVGASSGGGNRLPLVLRGKVTVLRKSLPGPQARLAAHLVVAGTGLRAMLAGLRGTGGRPGSGPDAWKGAWRTRAQWRAGWRPGDRLVPPVGEPHPTAR